MARKRSTASATASAAAPARTHEIRLIPSRPLVTSSASESAPAPDLGEIARLAYSYWEARGYQGGSPEEDWLRAEQELAQDRAMSARA